MNFAYKMRRSIAVLVVLVSITTVLLTHPNLYQATAPQPSRQTAVPTGDVADALNSLPIKGRAPQTGYTRTQFGNGWASQGGCDTRNIILRRDLANTSLNAKCQVVTGTLQDPYTGRTIQFQRGDASSQLIQIDHVVALSDAWQTGAQNLSSAVRQQLANDPLELLAVDGPTNQQKSDGDAATWLPPNKSFRCQYIARQIAVKKKYQLWVTSAEKDAMSRILSTCAGQQLPSS